MKMIFIDKTCPCCGFRSSVKVSEDDCDKYYLGTPAKIAFPELSKIDLEILNSGLCKNCQKNK